MNKPEDPKTRRFQDIFDTFDLVQHVKQGTHECTVQRRATKVINGFRDLSYQQRITRLNLPTLEFRRKKRVEMMEVFKITHNIYDAECCPKSKLSNRVGRSHSLKLFKPQVYRLDLRKYSFPVRIVDTWNNLPEAVISAPSINAFKNRLDKHWKVNPTLTTNC